MAFTIAIIVMWLFGVIFYFTPKKMSFLQNFVVFIVLVMISRNVMTILTMELHLIKTSQEPTMYMYFLIQRQIIKPLAVLFFVNVCFQSIRLGKKVMVFFIIFISLNILNYLALQLEVVHYVKWSLAFDLLYEGAYLMIGFVLSKLIVRVKET